MNKPQTPSPSRYNDAFLKVLRGLRFEKDIPQEKLIPGMTQSAVAHIERGTRGVSFEKFIAIADTCGEHPVSLMEQVAGYPGTVFEKEARDLFHSLSPAKQQKWLNQMRVKELS